jgi:hypothetical protein
MLNTFCSKMEVSMFLDEGDGSPARLRPEKTI